ncbi:hypothetical protein P7C73_g857, partial [Tremellales sp. Uapishka_1]
MAAVASYDYAASNGNGAPKETVGRLNDAEKSAVAGIVAKDENKGAPVFNPDATPEQKAAAAGKAKSQLAALPGAHLHNEASEKGGRAVTFDASTAASAPIPTVTISDIDKASKAEGQTEGSDDLPGAIPTGAAPAIPTWMLTGWRQVAGLDSIEARDEKHQLQMGLLADYLSDQAYGSLYHNAGIIVFSVLTTHLITLLHLGWGWIILILAVCGSYYTLSISRTRGRARDDIQRELVKTRLVTETESADWLNGFLDRFWLIYEPVLSQTIVASVDAAMSGIDIAGVESIKLTTFTPPRIDFVRTFPKTPEDVVIMDWALSFTPNDLEDITPKEAARRVNPKIVLAIKIGKGAVSQTLPILLEDMGFTGRMRIKLQLMTNFPHVQTIDLSFIEKPTFDYVLKPIGGETFGFDINNIPGLANSIRNIVHANLGPMMYDPNVFTIDLQSLLSGTPLDSAVGVLKVSIANARGLKTIKLGGGAPDPYVSIALGAKPAITKTQTINSSSNPSWNETEFILVNSLADVLNLNVFDYNDHRPDNLLGTVSHELKTLTEDAEQEAQVGKILGGGKDRGELRYDISFYPVLVPSKLPDGTVEPLPDTATGIVRLTIHQAKELDVTRAHGDLNPFAKVFLGGSRKPVHTTAIMKHANQPVWESSCEFLVPEKHSSSVTIQVIDSKDYASDPALGSVTVKLMDLLEAKERKQDWFPLSGSRAGKIRLSTEWKPVAMTGSISGAAAYVPPIGILRIWLKKAIDVKNVEAALGGKSDPYVRVMGNNKILARTEVINNNLSPEWDQIVYVPIHNPREQLILELMDFQNIGKDRTLGTVEISIAEYTTASADPKYPYQSKGSQSRSDPIRLGKANQYKGQLVYEAHFQPAVSLRGGVSFDAQPNELELEASKIQAGQNGSGTVTPNGNAGANGTAVGTVAGESKAGGEETEAENPESGVVMTTEELLSNQSGILVFQVISGQLSRRGSLEVMFDDGYWPSFTSGKARSSHPTWDQVGEGFVRELDFSRIWLRINAADDSEKEDIVAEFKCEAKDFLDQCMNQPADFLLSQADGSNRSVIRMSARYVPVDIKLEPRESINNMGILRVHVNGAKGLMAADRSGKSDPNVTFFLNGAKVFKSETKRKTLAPIWNEAFEVMIPSRVAAKFAFEIADWDRVGTSTSLGGGFIHLAALEPFEALDLIVPVVHEKSGEKGSLSVNLIFQPEIIARSRQKTSTFSTAGRALTQIGGLPLGVGKGVVHGAGSVGGGVFHGVGAVGGFAGRKIGLVKKKDKSGKEVLVEAAEPGSGPGADVTTANEGLVGAGAGAMAGGGAIAGFELPAGQTSAPANEETNGLPGPSATTLPAGLGQAPSEPGILTVTVISAKDLKGSGSGSGIKPYVQLKLGSKTHKTGHEKKGVEPEWNESFGFNVVPGSSSFTATVFDHHTLGKDPELGEAEIDIWRHIQPAVPNADVWVELREGQGLLRLRLDWGRTLSPATKLGRGRTASISSKNAPDSPSRFSMKSRKEKTDSGNGA